MPTMPVPTTAASGPTTAHPNCAVPRTDRPPAANPYPAWTAPIPITWHPVIIRAGSHWHHLDLGWRRSLSNDCHGRLWRCISIGRHRLWRLPIDGRRLNRAWLRLVKSLLSWLLLRLVNGLRAVNRHILHSSLHTACSKSDDTGEQDDRCQCRKAFYIVSFHPVALDTDRHENIQTGNEADWKLPLPGSPERFDVHALDTLVIDKAAAPQQAVSDPAQMKRRVAD